MRLLKPRLHDTTRLSNRLSNGFDNRLNVCIHDTTGCQTGLTTSLTTGLTTGCIMYTNIYPVVKPVVKPVWQQVVSCKRGFRVTLVSRVTARSLQNNIVGYVPPSGERSCNKCVKFNCLHLYRSLGTFVFLVSAPLETPWLMRYLSVGDEGDEVV